MLTFCRPLPPPVAHEMLQIAAWALCDRPGDKAVQRDSRTRQMIHTTLGFEPRDGLEYMLSTMVVGHFQLILDSMRDALRGQMDEVKARTKTTIVSLDRSVLSFIKEMRTIRHRPLAYAAEDRARAAASPEAAADAFDWVAEWAGLPPTATAEPAPAGMAPVPPAVVPPAAAAPATPTAKSGAAGAPPSPGPARSGPLAPASAASRAAPPPREPARDVTRAPGPSAVAAAVPHSVGMTAAAPDTDGDGTTAEHITAFQDALTAMAASLAEARALDAAKPGAKAATGD